MKKSNTILEKIAKPTLLLDREKALKNLTAMLDKVKKCKVRFRPHFKTHQSARIGEWFKKFGVASITVSSVEMAEYFANNGWKDISIAFPVNIREIDKINELTKKVQLHLLVESKDTIYFLQKHLANSVQMWIKVDTGYHRTGILWNEKSLIYELATGIKNSDKMILKGLLTHAGHTYHAGSKKEIKNIYNETVSRLKQAQTSLQNAGFQKVEISSGDTPSCSLIDDFSDVDEIRPGNFVFYDVTQLKLGACSEAQIAVGVACPVVAKHKERNELIIYGGAVHLSKEFITNKSGTKIFGLVVRLKKDGWNQIIKDCFVAGLSQEHGIIKTDSHFFESVNIGDVLLILPVHSCLTVNLMKTYLTFEGKKISTMSSYAKSNN